MKAISQPTVAARELRGYTGARLSPALVAEGVSSPARPVNVQYCACCIFEILLLDIGDRMGITKRKYVRYRSKSRTQVEE
jgi:hypothetical protein